LWKLKKPNAKDINKDAGKNKKGDSLNYIFPVHKIHVPKTNTVNLCTGINYKMCVQSRERPLKL
jgi:hypothetical protein